jgi:hypothetical protein
MTLRASTRRSRTWNVRGESAHSCDRDVYPRACRNGLSCVFRCSTVAVLQEDTQSRRYAPEDPASHVKVVR